MFEAVVSLDPELAARLTSRTRLRLHAGASEVGTRIAPVGGRSDSQRDLLARITANSPITLRGGDRFVLRLPAPLRTIGGGVVIDPYARRRAIPRDSFDNLASLVAGSGSRFLTHSRAEVSRDATSEAVASAALRLRYATLSTRVVHSSARTTFSRRWLSNK